MSCVCDCLEARFHLNARQKRKERNQRSGLLEEQNMSCRRRLEFPRDKYPPNVESKDLILRVTAAAEVDLAKEKGCPFRRWYTPQLLH